jgi:5-(carboxyamino)imidazole ribonucleotide synthase
MLALAAHALGIGVVLLDPEAEGSAAQVIPHTIAAPLDDLDSLRRLAAECDLITYENEWLDWQVLARLEAEGIRVVPAADTLRRIQDKFLQRACLAAVGLPGPAFAAVHTLEEIAGFAGRHGTPVVLKARVRGYDGRGVRIVERPEALAAAWEELHGRPLMVEAFVPFERELAVMVARSASGAVAAYPVVETIQRENVCHTVIAPAAVDGAVHRRAREVAVAAVEAFAGVGIFGVELFLEADGRVSINELAPRPHNSGHYTIDACLTSQFEQHLRAVLGLPLGDTALRQSAAVMVNILGEGTAPAPDLAAALAVPGVRVHWYGKPAARPGRKLGHINGIGTDPDTVLSRTLEARRLLNV